LPSAGGTVPAASSMSPGRGPARGGVIDSCSSADKPASAGSRRSAVGARRLSRTCRIACVPAQVLIQPAASLGFRPCLTSI
jgi:hypothetical protein